MTISSPTFQRLQDGIKSVDDLRVRGPVNAALTWLSGSLVTQLNTHFGEVSNSVSAFISVYASTRPTFSAHKNGTAQTSITNATSTKITFGTEEWDTGAHFASSTWTPPTGKYQINAQVTWAATNGVDQELLITELRKNGGVYKENVGRRNGTGALTVPINATVTANGTDTFEIWAFKGSAGLGDVGGAAADTWFQGHTVLA